MLDLRPPHVVAHAADFLAEPHDAAVIEPDELAVRLGIDLGDLEAVAIAGAFV